MFHPQGPTFWELARQALSSTETGYDLLAPKFDFTPFRTPDWLLDAVAPHLGTCEQALDICCGTGAAMRILRPIASNLVVGLDFSQQMLEEAQGQASQWQGEAAVHLVRANALTMPFEPSFDVAVCFGALGHILRRDADQFVDQIARSLKTGGRFVTVTSSMPPLWTPSYLLSRGFNAAMHIRNVLVRPPFIMFYLTFLIPDIERLFERHGFGVQVIDEPALRQPRFRVFVATKK